MPEQSDLPQWAIVNSWLPSLRQHRHVWTIWLEGSLARGDAHAFSDIDIRIAFDYLGLGQFRHGDRSILNGLGIYHISINAGDFLRLLTEDGYVIDLEVHSADHLPRVPTGECKTLFSYDPDGLFVNRDPWSVADFPANPVTREELQRQIIDFSVVFASIPSMVIHGEWESFRFQLDLMRIELVKLIYRAQGVQYAKEYKHFGRWMDRTKLAELALTYPDGGLGLPLAMRNTTVAIRNLVRIEALQNDMKSDVLDTVTTRVYDALGAFDV